MRTISAAIQFTGAPKPLNRPCTIHEVSLGHDRSRFVLQRGRKALDEIEQTLTTRCDMSAMLDVVGRPVALSRRVIALVEEGIERLKDNRLIFRFSCLFHFLRSLRALICATWRPGLIPGRGVRRFVKICRSHFSNRRAAGSTPTCPSVRQSFHPEADTSRNKTRSALQRCLHSPRARNYLPQALCELVRTSPQNPSRSRTATLRSSR